MFAGSSGCGDGLEQNTASLHGARYAGQAGDFPPVTAFSDEALSLTACAIYVGTKHDRIGQGGIISRRMT